MMPHSVRTGYALVGLVLACLTTGCSTYRESSTLTQIARSNCHIDSSGTSGYVFQPVELTPGSPEAALLAQRYGARGLRMAQAVGLTSLLLELTRLEQAGSEPTPAYLAVRQRITDQLQLANADIATATALLDCDIKRANLTATLLTRRENIREKRMTISAITIGAVAIIGASLLNLHEQHTPADWLHIAGGVGEGGLGVLALRQKPPRIAYTHPQNPLREVRERPKKSVIFPPLVWYYLNKPKSIGSEAITVDLRRRWEELLSLDAAARHSRKHQAEIDYFGDGDQYNAEALTLRATMLGQLETEIRLMNNDVTILLNEIVSRSARR